MRSVSDKEIDFILNDFTKKGIVLEDLRDNLLDHLCCVIENEMKLNDDFFKFYEIVLPRFFMENLKEIQTETDNLLRFKNFYAMKKTLKISGIATAVFTTLGALLKTFHLPGAGAVIVLGGFTLSFVFLPLLIALKFKDEESKVDKAVFTFGFLLAMILSTGLIFKLMHWPFATILMLSATVVFTFVYTPLYFFTRIKRPELKFNTIVNSVLMIACGGIFYSLFDLNFSDSYAKSMTENHIYLHKNSEKLFTSNEAFLANTLFLELDNELLTSSKSVNKQIEALVAICFAPQSANTEEWNLEFDKLHSEVKTYNEQVVTLQAENLSTITLPETNTLSSLGKKVLLNILARAQQQLAVNETCYLASNLKKESIETN